MGLFVPARSPATDSLAATALYNTPDISKSFLGHHTNFFFTEQEKSNRQPPPLLNLVNHLGRTSPSLPVSSFPCFLSISLIPLPSPYYHPLIGLSADLSLQTLRHIDIPSSWLANKNQYVPQLKFKLIGLQNFFIDFMSEQPLFRGSIELANMFLCSGWCLRSRCEGKFLQISSISSLDIG